MRIGAVIALAVAAGLLVWLLTRGGSHKAETGLLPNQVLPQIPAGTQVGPVTLPAAGVLNTAEALHQPVYWVGPTAGYRYQVERNPNGNVFVTYLPPGVASATNRGRFLAVGTYPVNNAFQALQTVADKAHAKQVSLPGGGIAVIGKLHANSVYVAYPKANTQIEVYAPRIAQARSLVLAGKLRPVG